MSTVGLRSIGTRPHRVTLQNPGPAVPDTDGGYTHTWVDLVPVTWDVSIEPATAERLERVTSGTVMAAATAIVRGEYRAAITTETRVLFNGRRLNVISVINPEERSVETVLVCAEVVT